MAALTWNEEAASAACSKHIRAAAPGGLLLQFFEHLGKLAEVAKLLAAALGVFGARRRQHKHLRAVQPFFLQPGLASPLREILKRRYAIESNDLRRVLFELLRQQDASLGKFLARQFLDPARGTLDEVGQPYPKLDHSFVIAVIKQFRHHARIIKQRPEFVSAARVIMADASRAIARVASDDDHFHAV